MVKNDIDREMLIIGNENEFLVKSVIAEMTRRGYTCITSKPNISEVNERGKGIRVNLLFIESAEKVKDLLVYLKDTAFDKKMEIGLVGESLELQESAKYIKDENIGKLFKRPVDAKQISDGLEELARTAAERNEQKRILIIDDDPEYLRRTQQILHNHYKIYLANSGVSGIKLLAKHKVDLILLDYIMPVLDGPKVLEALKQDPDLADIPVVFLSGKTDAKAVTTAMTLGSENYLSKSLAAKDLAAMVSDIFAKIEWNKKH